MPLLRAGRFATDTWRPLADSDGVPASGRIIVPLPRLLAEAEAFARFAGELGVRVEPKERVEQLESWLPRLALIALSFPSFSDGRAFSTARILRERYGFTGEVRAVGEILVDRYQFMRQCGFDAFEVTQERTLASWSKASVEMTLTYQADYAEPRGAEAVWRTRQAQHALAAE
jgi:uncharacterized protein (DUF934 family)